MVQPATNMIPPVPPLMVLSYIAGGLAALAVLLLATYCLVCIYGLIRYGSLERAVKYMSRACWKRRKSVHNTPADIEAINPFRTPPITSSGDSESQTVPDWAVKYKQYLDLASPERSGLLSPLSPASSCASPITPLNTYPRGLGIVLEEEEPVEGGPHIPEDDIYPPGPTIVIQCDEDYDGESPVATPSDPSSYALEPEKTYLSVPHTGWEEEDDSETEQYHDIC